MPITIKNSDESAYGDVELWLDRLESLGDQSFTKLSFDTSGAGIPIMIEKYKTNERYPDEAGKITLIFRGIAEREAILMSLYRTLSFYFNNKNHFRTTLSCKMD